MTNTQEMEIIRATIAGCADAWYSGLYFEEMMALACDAKSIDDLDARTETYCNYIENLVVDPQEILIDVIV